jgi:hypothetical protein
MPATHYVFVDFENIQEVDLDLVAGNPVVVILVLGERHKTLPVEMVKQFLKYPSQVRLIEAGRSGRNALDFVLAYRIGVESAADPRGFFHIVSRDTGFDALILHLKQNNILAERHESFAKALGQTEANLPALRDRLDVVIGRLTKNMKSRPRRKKTLLSQINAYFGKLLTEVELEAMLKALVDKQIIELTPRGDVVTRYEPKARSRRWWPFTTTRRRRRRGRSGDLDNSRR